MNKHFEDTRYYLKRAGETAKKGISEELKPVRERAEELTGEKEEKPGRVEKLREELAEIQSRAGSEAIGEARERLNRIRETPEQQVDRR